MATAKRNTWQKQVIYSVMKELTSHPTASELYDELVKRGYDIGTECWQTQSMIKE